jgi:hypothetical protein
MAIRLRYKIELTVSSTIAEENDLGNVKYNVSFDSQNEGGSWKTLLAAGATDVELQLPNIADARFLAIRTTAKDPTLDPIEIAIKINGVGGEARKITPVTGTKEGFYLQTTDGITSVHATNAGSVDMELIVFAAGD